MKTDPGLVFLFSILLVSFVVVPVVAAGNIQILTNTSYVDLSGYYTVVGEVINSGDAAVTFVEITATFYGSNGSIVATRKSVTMMQVILPSRKSPFMIQLLDTQLSQDVDHYSLSFSFLPAVAIPSGLVFVSNTSFLDVDGFHVSGEIKNVANDTARQVRVIVTCYDASARVVAAKLKYINEIYSDLDPNQTEAFEILLSERGNMVSVFELTAESAQYALIPEFPHVLILVLLGIGTATVARTFARVRRKHIS